MRKTKNTAKPKKKPITPEAYLKTHIDIDYEDDNLIKVTHHGKTHYMILLIISGIDIFHFSSLEQQAVFDNFATATASLKFPHKYVFTEQSPSLSAPYAYLNYKRSRSSSPYIAQLIERDLQRIRSLEHNQKNKIAYLEIFCDSKNKIGQLKASAANYIYFMSDTNVRQCTKSEAIDFLQTRLRFVQKHNEDIFPQIVKESEAYVNVDGQYVTSLRVFGYPAYIDDLLFASLFYLSDAVVTMDIDIMDKSTILTSLRNSMKEIDSRYVIERQYADKLDDSAELGDLTSLYDAITRGTEKMLCTTLRFFLCSDTLEGLQKKTEDCKTALDNLNIESYVEYNCLFEEYLCALLPANNVENPTPLHDTFKKQYPFYYQSHVDEKGTFLGFTQTGGVVFLDTFRRERGVRESFDLLITGMKGSGKTVFLKSQTQTQIMLGNKVYILDIENEFAPMANILGGTVINMSKTARINPLQIRQTIVSSREDKDTQITSNFAAELDRMVAFISQYATMTDIEASEIKDILTEIFYNKGITEFTDTSALHPDDYPILSDVYDYIAEACTDRGITQRKKEIYENLMIYIKPLALGIYSSLFNGYTTVDVANSDLVVFNVKPLSNLDERIYNAQLFNIVTLMWNGVCDNITVNDSLKTEHDRKHVICVIDEAKRFLNAKNRKVVEFIDNLASRSRKYDAALWFASQATMDFFPENSETDIAETIKRIFSLIQYKVVMKQPEASWTRLAEVYPQFTESELHATASFQSGEMLLSLGGGRHKLHCNKYVCKSDLLYMGNSKDVHDIISDIFNTYYGDIALEDVAKQLATTKQRVDFKRIFLKEVFDELNLDIDRTPSELSEIVSGGIETLINEKIGGFYG